MSEGYGPEYFALGAVRFRTRTQCEAAIKVLGTELDVLLP